MKEELIKVINDIEDEKFIRGLLIIAKQYMKKRLG
jgi:hypothetical protein